MIEKIKIIIKNNRIIYIVYYYVFSLLLRLIGLFCKIDEHLILFNSFGGVKYDDSPKSIYEYMINSKKYENYKLVWGIDDIKLVDNNDILFVRNNTFKYFVTALKAKYWITNTSIERGLKFKKKKTVYINTWHGSALKYIGNDANNQSTKFKNNQPDYFYAQSKYDVNVFSNAFKYDKHNIKLVGLPRNDELCFVTDEEIISIKNKLKLPKGKKIILYAPTFRDYDRDKNGCIIAPPVNIEEWRKQLGKKYIILFRAHHEVNKVLNIKDDGFIYNMTLYPTLNDLLKISDILISDYSSIMIDYSILERPIYCYAYDYEEYKEKRGLYVDLAKELPNGICKNEKKLLNEIKCCNIVEQRKKTKKFKSKYVEKCGNATKYIDEIILGE